MDRSIVKNNNSPSSNRSSLSIPCKQTTVHDDRGRTCAKTWLRRTKTLAFARSYEPVIRPPKETLARPLSLLPGGFFLVQRVILHVSLLVKNYPWSRKRSLEYINAIVEDSLTEHRYTCDILHTSKNERTGIRMFTDVRSRLFMLEQIGSHPNSRSMYEN